MNVGRLQGNNSFISHRIAALDGLRAIAILAVILAHANFWFGGAFARGPIAGPLASILGVGWIGVDLFFVLSGFLITRILENSKNKAFYLRNFYARRALRIMPLLYAYVIAILAFSWLGLRLVSNSDAISVLAYYYNFRVAETGYQSYFVHPFWSLAVEEHFYLLWPFAVLALSRSSLMRLCLVGMAFCFFLRVGVVMSGAWLQVAYLITPCRLDGLMGGSFLALALDDPAWRERLRRYCGPLAIGCAGVLLGLLLGQRHFLDFVDFRKMPDAGVAMDSSMVVTIGISIAALLFAAVLALVMVRGSEPNAAVIGWLKHPWLVAIGKYSYGMYVLHTLVMGAIVHSAARFFPAVARLPDYVAKPCLGLLVIALSFVAAYLSYNVFEKRFLSMKKYFDSNGEASYAANRAIA